MEQKTDMNWKEIIYHDMDEISKKKEGKKDSCGDVFVLSTEQLQRSLMFTYFHYSNDLWTLISEVRQTSVLIQDILGKPVFDTKIHFSELSSAQNAFVSHN